MLDGKAIHIPDVLADPEYHATDYQRAFGYRTILGVPLLRDGALARKQGHRFRCQNADTATKWLGRVDGFSQV